MTHLSPHSAVLCQLDPVRHSGLFTCSDTAGLTRGAIFSLAQDTRGYLWLGTEDGPVRFDGRGWDRMAAHLNLQTATIWTLDADASGLLWIGADGAGLSLVDTTTTPCRLATRLTVADGLADSDIHGLCRDSADSLWVATHQGLAVVMDRRVVRLYSAADGIPDAGICALCGDRQQRVWAGSLHGLLCFTDGHLERSLRTPQGLPDEAIYALSLDHDNRVWVGTRDGLAIIGDDGTVQQIIQADLPSGEIRALCPAGAGRMWVGTAKGLALVEQQRVAGVWTRRHGLPSSSVWALLHDRDNRLWIGTDDGLAMLPAAGHSIQATSLNETVEGGASSFAGDPLGRLWIGTRQGLVIADPTDPTRRAATALTPTSHEPHSVSELVASQQQPVTTVTPSSHEPSRAAYPEEPATQDATALTPSSHEPSCAAYQGGFITRDAPLITVASHPPGGTGQEQQSSGDREMPHDMPSPDSSVLVRAGICSGGEFVSAHRAIGGDPSVLARAGVWAIHRDAAGHMWAGGRFGGLFCFDPLTHAPLHHVAEINAPLCLAHGDEDQLWIGTNGTGLYAIDPTSGTLRHHLTTQQGLPGDHISALCPDGTDHVWVATQDGGLARLNRRTATVERVVDSTHGLPSPSLSGLAMDSMGRLWCATRSGLACLDPAQGHVIGQWSSADGLPADALHSCTFDAQGTLWLGTAHGLARFLPDTGRCLAVGSAHGMASDYCQPGALHADPHGHVWAGTADGVAIVTPATFPVHVPPCAVFFTGLWVMDQPRAIVDELTIVETDYDVLIEYGAVEYTAPARVVYRTQLVGLEDEWSDLYVHRFCRYTNLSPGRYLFRVSARNWGGAWSPPAELAVHIQPDLAARALHDALEQQRIEAEVQRATADQLRVLNTVLLATQLLQLSLHKQLQAQKEVFERLANEDSLTGLLTRRVLDEKLGEARRRSMGKRRPLAVALVDLDRFKSINDTYSHQVGDAVLKTVAQLCQAKLRTRDIIGRYGGEEIGLVFPNTTLAEALLVCERLREMVAAFPWATVAPGLRVTLSIGICHLHDGMDTAAMLAEADMYLYMAKDGGRNRTCCALTLPLIPSEAVAR